MMTAVYILAGGESKRYGKDKLIELVDGHVTLNGPCSAASTIGQVYFVGREVDRCRLYSAVTGCDTVCILDRGFRGCGSGPGQAILTALMHAREHGFKRAVIVAGDMAWVTSGILYWLLSSLTLADSSTVITGTGFLESLLQAHRVEAFDETRLVDACRLRGYLRPTDFLRASRRLALLSHSLWMSCTRQLAHLNTPEDLRIRGSRNPPADRTIILVDTPGFQLECRALEKELAAYRILGVKHLVKHVVEDMERIGCSHRA